LKEINGKVKKAIIMIYLKYNYDEAEKRLEKDEGHVRHAL